MGDPHCTHPECDGSGHDLFSNEKIGIAGGRLAPLMSSAKHDWETPDALFNGWDVRFHFTLDVCATAENAKCNYFYSPEDDGLNMPWAGRTCWMNPPYGRQISDWVVKAHLEAIGNKVTTVALLPARTDTRWFHDQIYKQHKIHFLRGRIKFVGAPHPAPFPSMIVVFGQAP